VRSASELLWRCRKVSALSIILHPYS
jgi:hypothetical protein